MIIYPAIDIKRGCVVRLFKGKMDQDTVYGDDPAAQARLFEQNGFKWLHVVDLDGAVEGRAINTAAIKSIKEAVSLPVQLGGGIRTLDQIETWISSGIDRVILGTSAVSDPELVKQSCREFQGRIAVGVDADGDDVMVEGWTQKAGMNVFDLAKTLEDFGVCAIIYTDIERDGTGAGVNIENTRNLARSISIPVIASGGVGSMQDIERLETCKEDGVEGVIIGRALYDGRISVDDLVGVQN